MIRTLPDSPPATPYRVLLLVVMAFALVTTAEHWASMQQTATDPSWQTIGHALKSELPRWGAWLLAVPPARWLIRRSQWTGWRIIPSALAHVGLAGVMIVVHNAVLIAGHLLIGFPTGPSFWPIFRLSLSLGNLPGSLVGYAGATGAALSIDYYLRFRERSLAVAALDRELTEARLEALQRQLNPHFLFNALNTVSMLVRRGDGEPAVDMLAKLSQFLRATLDSGGRHEVPLADELAQVERYLDIERVRFGDRLRATVEASAGLDRALVPALALQPLVENAIRHGVGARRSGGIVSVTSRRDGDRLVLEVDDNGPGPGLTEASPGIGLANTRARLTALYGAESSLVLEALAPEGTRARIVLPYHTVPA